MKTIIISSLAITFLLGIWATFIGFPDGVDNASSGNYLTVDGDHSPIILDKQTVSVNIDDNLVLHGEVQDAFAGRTRIMLKLKGSRNRSLLFGADPLPASSDIARIVQNQLIEFGAPPTTQLSTITLPLQ
jgi:hypothetical protein